MAKVFFIFSSPALKLECTFDRSLDIGEMKKVLLKDFWPETINKERVSSIRFFCMGKELFNHFKLDEFHMPDPSMPIPILVHMVEKSFSSENNNRDDSFCSSCFIT